MNLTDLLSLTIDSRWAGTKSELDSVRNARRVVDTIGATALVKKVTAPRIRRAAVALREEGLSPASVNRHMAALGAMLTVACQEGIIPSKPHIPHQREPEGRSRVLTFDEQDLLIAQLPAADGQLVSFLLETGARVSEALRLTWGDIDSTAVGFRNTKTSRPRRVPLTAKARRVLAGIDRSAAGPFAGLNQRTFNHRFAQARKAAGLGEEVVPHILRHTCASRLVRAGAPIQAVQAWLGHSSIVTTTRYAHLDTSALDGIAGLLEG